MLNLKKILLICLIALALVFSLTNITRADNVILINCQDENLYNELCSVFTTRGFAFDKNDTQLKITLQNGSDLDNITILDLSNKEIKKLDGLEKFTSLSKLDLSNNDLFDLTPIGNLYNIDVLDISDTGIKSIEPLSGLITTLEDGTPVGLTSLIAKNNRITSVTPLSRVITLQEINLSNNNISDVSSLAALNKLASLDVSKNKLTSIDALLTSENLREIVASNNNIIDVNVNGDKTPVVTKLFLNNNKIEKVDFVAALENLTNLNLAKNNIRFITPEVVNLMNNHSTGFSFVNQEIELVTMDKSINLEKNNNYTNLLEWSNYFMGETPLTVENGKLEGYDFTFEDESKVGQIIFDDGVFKGSVITISYSASNATAPAVAANTTTVDNNTNTNTTELPSNNTVTNTAKEDVTTDDGTTATGKMPYTGITSKVVGIASLVTILGAIVAYTYSQNKKNINK